PHSKLPRVTEKPESGCASCLLRQSVHQKDEFHNQGEQDLWQRPMKQGLRLSKRFFFRWEQRGLGASSAGLLLCCRRPPFLIGRWPQVPLPPALDGRPVRRVGHRSFQESPERHWTPS